MRGVLLASASLITLGLSAGVASAQQKAPAADAPVQAEEIVVTAQKREQRLQDVPVAVSVVNGAQLKRQSIVSAADLQYAVPELSFIGGPEANYQVRGVGTTTFTRSAENDVSVVVDGIVQGQLQPPTNSLFDVQRVEVLSGPQGMLFGKNASAGLINIVTNAPNLSRYEVSGHIDAGENGYQVYQGVANLPLTSNAALRISAFSNSEDGLIKNLHTGNYIGAFDDAGARVRLLWNPTNTVRVNIIADYEKDHGGDSVWQARSAAAGGVLNFLLNACGVHPGATNTKVCLDGPSSLLTESYGLSGQVDWQIGDYTVTSITADRQYSRYNNIDSDTTSLNLLDRNVATDFDNQFSEELRLTSPAGKRVEYVAGLYFYDYNYKPFGDQAGGLGFLPAGVNADRASLGKISQFSYAVFGQATIHVFDKFSLILGGRETNDILRTSSTSFVIPTSGIFIPGFSGAPGTTYADSNVSNFSYRVGAQYKFSPDGLLYVTYSKGYKGAAANTLTPGQVGNPIVRPEIPIDIEGGLKTSLFERKVILDLSVYDEDFQNFQAQVIQTIGGLTTFQFGNASHLYVKGAQANVTVHPIADLTMNGGLIYDDATYGNFLVPCDFGYSASCTTIAGSPYINVKGRQLAAAPKWKLVLSGEYQHRVTDNLDGFVQADVNYRTGVNTSSTPDPNLAIGGYALANGRIGVRSPDGRWSVAIFAKNMFDERFPAIVFLDPLQPHGNYDQSFTPDAFRVIGASLDFRY